MLLVLDFKPPIHPPLVGVLDPTPGHPAAAVRSEQGPAAEARSAVPPSENSYTLRNPS